MNVPWFAPVPVAREAFPRLRRRAIFETCKWDPQVGDVGTLSRWPVLLRPEEWERLTTWAERLAAEAVAAEREIVRRGLLDGIGLPWRIRRAIRRLSGREWSSRLRIMRFDFHFTTDGWRISEVNSDVPGGFNEASGFSRLVCEEIPGTRIAGDPAAALCQALEHVAGGKTTVGLVHATAFSDDRQVMTFLARELEARGHCPVLLAPNHLHWGLEGARGRCEWFDGSLDCVLRFFPAEWLPGLGLFSNWHCYFAESRTTLCNPATALVSQSKRFPLLWGVLDTPLPTWRKLLPHTLDPAHMDWRDNTRWVLKPALGRVGDGVGISGCISERDWKSIRADVTRHPEHWIAQELFQSVPMETPDGPFHVCVGVFTVNGRAAGAYGRVAGQPLIDHRAADTAVLLGDGGIRTYSPTLGEHHELGCHL